MTRETYRWAVVDKDGGHFTAAHQSEEQAMSAAVEDMWEEGYTEDEAWKIMLGLGYTVKKFRLVECAEGEGE